jgi:hypothetical protein
MPPRSVCARTDVTKENIMAPTNSNFRVTLPPLGGDVIAGSEECQRSFFKVLNFLCEWLNLTQAHATPNWSRKRK